MIRKEECEGGNEICERKSDNQMGMSADENVANWSRKNEEANRRN